MSESMTWNQGFPDTTPEEDAKTEALASFNAFLTSENRVMVGDPTSITKISTPEHAENHEYLIRIKALYDTLPQE